MNNNSPLISIDFPQLSHCRQYNWQILIRGRCLKILKTFRPLQLSDPLPLQLAYLSSYVDDIVVRWITAFRILSRKKLQSAHSQSLLKFFYLIISWDLRFISLARKVGPVITTNYSPPPAWRTEYVPNITSSMTVVSYNSCSGVCVSSGAAYSYWTHLSVCVVCQFCRSFL